MWIEQGINLFDEGLFRDFGKPRTANAFLSCLQVMKKKRCHNVMGKTKGLNKEIRTDISLYSTKENLMSLCLILVVF